MIGIPTKEEVLEDRVQSRLHQKAFEDIFNLIALNKEKAPNNEPDHRIDKT